MSLYVCPQCNKTAFTWRIDEEETPLTQWRCGECGYQALEDESKKAKDCPSCQGKEAAVEFKDDKGVRLYCFKCHVFSPILEQ